VTSPARETDYLLSPRFAPCITWGTGVAVGLTLVFVALEGLNGSPTDRPLTIASLSAFLGFAVAAGLVLGALVWLGGRIGGVVATADGLRAGWRRRKKLSWASISVARPTASAGVPMLMVMSSPPFETTICIITLGLDRREVHETLARLAGQDHVLTLSFEAAGSTRVTS